MPKPKGAKNIQLFASRTTVPTTDDEDVQHLATLSALTGSLALLRFSSPFARQQRHKKWHRLNSKGARRS